jgi:tryptophanyl-tRNA synthetase
MVKEAISTEKQIAVSGVQPSGDIHVGNYLGAIKQFIELQNNYHTYFFIADLHALTEQPDPKQLEKRTIELAAMYLACGLDPKKTTLFLQSHIHQHTELGWILNTMTPMGELERMTQYKEKSEKHGVLAGLFNYPTLMAADILLYQPDTVPVGEDQVQHLELTRTLARKFNNQYGNTFKEPKAILQKGVSRIMSMKDPTIKMSKSSGMTAPAGNAHYIGILDDEKTIKNKIKSAVTDSGSEIKHDKKNKPAISNLLTIFSAFQEQPIKEIEKEFSGKSYADFKSALTDLLVEKLSPIQARYRELSRDQEHVLSVLKEGAKKAEETAENTMCDVREKIGLLQK